MASGFPSLGCNLKPSYMIPLIERSVLSARFPVDTYWHREQFSSCGMRRPGINSIHCDPQDLASSESKADRSEHKHPEHHYEQNTNATLFQYVSHFHLEIPLGSCTLCNCRRSLKLRPSVLSDRFSPVTPSHTIKACNLHSKSDCDSNSWLPL